MKRDVSEKTKTGGACEPRQGKLSHSRNKARNNDRSRDGSGGRGGGRDTDKDRERFLSFDRKCVMAR